MEHVTTVWKTTLALVLRNLQVKTVKVCLVFVSLFSHYFHTAFFPCHFFVRANCVPRELYLEVIKNVH